MTTIETEVPTEAVSGSIIEVTPSALAQLSSVAASASADEYRPLLTALHLYTKDGELVADCTDSYTLARVVVPFPGSPDFDALIPAKWLVTSLKAIKAAATYKKGNAPLTLSIVGESVTLSSHEVTFSAQLLTGTYPSVDQLIPSGDKLSCELGAFNAQILTRMAAVLPAPTKKDAAPWRCESMSLAKPALWTRRDGDARALFLAMPYKLSD